MIDEPFAEPYMTAEEQDELAPLARLESQNQALQEELATTQEAYRFKSREADANGREVENKAAILNAIEALLDVDDEHTGWDRIVALQERIEGALKYLDDCDEGAGTPSITSLRVLLSPTQETGPE